MTTLAERVDRLFVVGHGPHEPERSADSVAAALSAEIGAPISEQDIKALRAGTHPGATDELLTALARHFGAPANYLTDLPETAHIDLQFRGLIAARDAQILGICFRGGDDERVNLETLVGELEDLVRRRRGDDLTGDGTPA